MSVLEKIVAESRKRAALLPETIPGMSINQVDFTQALRRRGKLPQLIAELKRKSPSKGTLKEGLSVAEAVRLYEPYAAALSILTEPEHFMGSLADLAEARTLTPLPLLRKDFIVDRRQIDEARQAGASSFLLIVASLTDAELAAFVSHGRALGMEPLVEVLTEEKKNWSGRWRQTSKFSGSITVTCTRSRSIWRAFSIWQKKFPPRDATSWS
jgi:indole-3-glycerol phosphate synthase